MKVTMQAEMRAWMAQAGFEPLPMGYNEVVDSAHASSAGYHLATAVALEQSRADHAALGCWAPPGMPSGSTCWDGSMDGLLDPSANFTARPKYWALRWYRELPAALLRIEPFTVDSGCNLAAAGGRLETNAGSATTSVVGRFQLPPPGMSKLVNYSFPASAAERSATLEHVFGCSPPPGPCPAVAAPTMDGPRRISAGVPGLIQFVLDAGDVVRITVTTA